jgi:hypothetical protein
MAISYAIVDYFPALVCLCASHDERARATARAGYGVAAMKLKYRLIDIVATTLALITVLIAIPCLMVAAICDVLLLYRGYLEFIMGIHE